jgi:hypothetical protein
MNPLGRLWLTWVVQQYSRKGGNAYDQGISIKGGSRPDASGGLLSPLRRSYGAGAGARARVVRMALRQLRGTGRSGHSCSSPARRCASRIRERVRQPRFPFQLASVLAGIGGRYRPLFRRSQPSSQSASREKHFTWWRWCPEVGAARRTLRDHRSGRSSESVRIHAPCSALIVRDTRGCDAHT